MSLNRSRGSTPAPLNISTSDLAKSQKEQKEAELMLVQMRKKVEALRTGGGKSSQLNASLHAKEELGAKRSAEVREMRKQTVTLLDQRRQEEARRLRKTTQAEKDRKEQSRNQMYVAFQKKRNDMNAKNDEWKQLAAQTKKEREEYRLTLHDRSMNEKHASRSRRSKIIADIEKSKRLAHEERLKEVQQNKRYIERRTAWKAEENAVNVSRVKEIQYASAEAKRKVEERNHQARSEQLTSLKKVRDEEMSRVAQELEELRREELKLMGRI